SFRGSVFIPLQYRTRRPARKQISRGNVPSTSRKIVVSFDGNDYHGFMMMQEDETRNPADDGEPPPFLGTWNRLYAAVIIYTSVLILALYIMTVTLNH